MSNVNGIINKANKKARVALETEVIRVVEIVEEGVLDHYFKLLEPLQQGLDILYNELEKPNFTKLPRKEFDELVYENFQTRLGFAMIGYSENAHDLTLKIGREQKANDEFCEFMKLYKKELLEQGVKPKRVNMEARKILYTMSCRLVTMLNSFGDNINKQFSGYCEYLLDSINFYRDNYTIDVDVPKAEDIEVEIEREGYEKIANIKDMIDYVESHGYVFKRQNGTSHRIYENADGKIVVVPVHGKTFNIGLGYAIQREIKMA